MAGTEDLIIAGAFLVGAFFLSKNPSLLTPEKAPTSGVSIGQQQSNVLDLTQRVFPQIPKNPFIFGQQRTISLPQSDGNVITSQQIIPPAPLPTNMSSSKWYQAFLRPTATQNQQVSIYNSLLDSGDHVRGAPQNISQSAAFSQFKGIEYGSLANFEAGAPGLKGKFNFIGLDLETGLSPSNDTANPVATAQKADSVAHANGLLFQLATNPGTISMNQWGNVAKFCDILDPQGQSKIKQSVNIYTNFIKSVSSAARAANPNIQILAQMTVETGIPLSTLQQATTAVAPFVDGFTCWFGDTTITQMQQYLQWFNSHF